MTDPVRAGHGTDDLVEALLDRLRQTATASAHGAALARDLFEHRDDLRHALATLHRIDVEDRNDLFFTEAERAYKRDPQRLSRSGSRSALVMEWVEVLVEALEAVRDTLSRADHFREIAEGMTDEDREYRDAMRRKNAERLREAS